MAATGEGMRPCLISYGVTQDSDIPLLLVVGREPNGTAPVTDDCGSYDFYKTSRGSQRAGSPFWDTAYGLMGAATVPPIDTKSFKALAAAKGVSPLIFSDALPHGIDHSVRNQLAQRLAIPTAYLEDHVARIFRHEAFIQRVRIVLLAGFDQSFSRSSRLFEAECEKRNIPVQHVPFFSLQNGPAIRHAITQDSWTILASIAASLAAHPPLAAGPTGPLSACRVQQD